MSFMEFVSSDGKIVCEDVFRIRFELNHKWKGFKLFRAHLPGGNLWMVRFEDGTYEFAVSLFALKQRIEQIIMEECE